MFIDFMGVNDLQGKEFRLYRENGTPDLLFVLFKSPAEVWAEGAFRQVGWGRCILFDENRIQHYFPAKGAEFLHDFIHFKADTEQEKQLLLDIPKGVPMELSLPDTVSSLLTEIQAELHDVMPEHRSAILDHLTAAFLLRLKKELTREKIDSIRRPYYQRFHRLRSEIYRDPLRAGSISEMAEQLHISSSHFQHLYKEFFSVSCTEDVIAARVGYAKLLLVNSDLKVYEISERCGCASTEHFIRQFRRSTGLSPGQYRSQSKS
ncbi:MAG: helix-turn-helix transcriptional regulator [Oscillospiraceae bacterium]|nr:helix-turn-helix transcriptional regulator [Oscillospiraceae bacterium]